MSKLTANEREQFVALLRKTALDVADDGTGTHIDTLWWQAADMIEELTDKNLYANPSMELILQAVPMLQWRKCWNCGRENLHRDNICPAVLCPVCGSQDTRQMKEANKILHRLEG